MTAAPPVAPGGIRPWETEREWALAAIRRLQAERSVEYFAHRYLGHEKWRWLRDFDQALTEPLPAGVNIRVVHAPVDQGKSVRLSAHVARRIAQDRGMRVLYMMNNGDLADERVRVVRNALLKNELLVRDYWHPTYGPFFWTEREATETAFRVRGADRRIATPTLEAKGIKEGVEGQKYHLVVVDDGEDDESFTSKAERDKAYTKLNPTLLGRLEPGGEIWWVGAPWHEDDAGNRALRDLRHQTRHYVFDAILEETGTWPEGSPYAGRPKFRPLCPERFGEHGEGLLSKGYGTTIFNVKYRCNVKALSGGTFTIPPTVTLADLTGPMHGGLVRLGMGFDPNRSDDEGSDWTAIVSLGLAKSGLVVLLRAWRKHLKTGWAGHIAAEYDTLRREWPGVRFSRIEMEDVGFQDEIRLQLRRERPDIPTHPVKRSKDKVIRLTGRLEPFFNLPGRFAILQGAPFADDFRDEVRMFPHAKFDLLDACESALIPLVPEKQVGAYGSLDLS
ncbi:MAG TPA: hypothetical protein VFH78_10745 [Candidatus Thermoplasmatota archaeon]|nr:hypothetical protein [Candidatus Thermoplasmatota archaeon]